MMSEETDQCWMDLFDVMRKLLQSFMVKVWVKLDLPSKFQPPPEAESWIMAERTGSWIQTDSGPARPEARTSQGCDGCTPKYPRNQRIFHPSLTKLFENKKQRDTFYG